MLTDEIKYLVNRYFSDSCTFAEKEKLARWIDKASSDDEIKKALEEAWHSHEPVVNMPEDMAERIVSSLFQPVENELATEPAMTLAPIRRVRFIRRSWWAAAVFILLAGAGGYFFFSSKKQQNIANTKKALPYDAPPGQNGAVLTLVDGSKVTLDSAGNQQIADQGNVQVTNQNGQLAYTIGDKKEEQVSYNILSTPRARQYQLVLPDGTKVWLNASSSIRYPTAFIGNSREVEITGEAYFEVVHNEAKPFIVKTGEILIKDIGTAFNVNAYDDEPSIKTTLIEGLVQLSAGKTGRLLKPGLQGVVKNGANEITIEKVNTAEVIGWKNGVTVFDNEDIQTIMRQVSRWYDVDVVIEGNISDRHFVGGISRKSNLSDLLKILEFENVHFVTDGKKIVVKP